MNLLAFDQAEYRRFRKPRNGRGAKNGNMAYHCLTALAKSHRTLTLAQVYDRYRVGLDGNFGALFDCHLFKNLSFAINVWYSLRPNAKVCVGPVVKL
jgi:hypothetical protein